MTAIFLTVAILVSFTIFIITQQQCKAAYLKGRQDGVTDLKKSLAADHTGLAMKHFELEVMNIRKDMLCDD